MANLLIIFEMIVLGVLPYTTSHECSQPLIRNIDIKRGDDITLDVPFVTDHSYDDEEISLRRNTSGQTLPPCNNRTLKDVAMKVQPCWRHVSFEDEREVHVK